MKKVLLLCSGSPCRGMMAEALLTKEIAADKDVLFIGAGMECNSRINEYAMKILEEEGVDISKLQPKVLDDVVDEDFDLIVTMCAYSKEACPQFPRKVPTIHMEFPVLSYEDESTCREMVKRIKTRLKPVLLRELTE